MPIDVSDSASNPNDQIAHAANVLGRSKHRAAVFAELHRGKKRIKTATEVANRIKLPRKRVLEEGIKLVHKHIVEPTKVNGEVAYKRRGFYYANKAKILALAANPRKLKQYATKYTHKGGVVQRITIHKSLIKTRQITIADIDSFSRSRKVRSHASALTMVESTFKKGVQAIIGEGGRFKDWGGETSDLLTTRLKMAGKRTPAAFAFKGKGLRGTLVPGRMGKNGDQIQRLFIEDASVFLVQYGGQIAGSVTQLMAQLAQAKSATTGRRILYGVIDGADSARLVAAYPAKFKRNSR